MNCANAWHSRSSSTKLTCSSIAAWLSPMLMLPWVGNIILSPQHRAKAIPILSQAAYVPPHLRPLRLLLPARSGPAKNARRGAAYCTSTLHVAGKLKSYFEFGRSWVPFRDRRWWRMSLQLVDIVALCNTRGEKQCKGAWLTICWPLEVQSVAQSRMSREEPYPPRPMAAGAVNYICSVQEYKCEASFLRVCFLFEKVESLEYLFN